MAQPSAFFKRTFVLLLLSSFGLFWSSEYWKTKEVIEWDITLYYSYLPAAFIHQNFHLYEVKDPEWSKRHFSMQQDAEGNHYTKMTSGLSILWSPFFLAAHDLAQKNPQFEANGFSQPYRYALLLSALLFAMAGVYCLGRFLLYYFDDKAAILASLAIFIGSNMLFYTYVSPMSHVYSFALISFILWQVQIFVHSQKYWRAIFIGLAAGLVLLIRPTNIVAFLFPILILFKHREALEIPKLRWQLLTSVIFAFIACVPQLLYWKHMTGNWIVYSYGEEGFFFSDPEIWKGLFSYRKGWFLYAPILFFAALGFVPLFKKDRFLGTSVLVVLFTSLWITFSWWCWWYGGSFGSRPMIEFLPFMALPLAAVFQWLLNTKNLIKVPGLTLIALACALAVFMNWQYSQGLIHYDSMSKELYWNIFLEDHYIKGYDEMLSRPDYEAALKNKD